MKPIEATFVYAHIYCAASVGIALALLSKSCAASEVRVKSGVEKSNVVWNSPSTDSRGSMPIGNGDIGANVWVEPTGDLLLLLSKTDAWDENMRLIKLGQVRIRLEPALDVQAGFRQELKLRDGAIEIQTTRATLRVWIDAHHPVVQVDGRSLDNKPLAVVADLEVWRTEKKPCDPGYPNFVEPAPFSWPDTVMKAAAHEVAWYHRNAVSPWLSNLKIQKLEALAKTEKDPIQDRTFGAVMKGDGMIATSDTQLKTAKPLSDFSLRVHALTQPNATAEEWRASLTKQVAATETVPSAERLAAHRQWWVAFWDRSWIFLSGDAKAEAVSRGYTLQRWVSACNGRGAYPIKFNGSIFVVDQAGKTGEGADFRRWGGCYWYQNTRLSYWPMLLSGDVDMMLPFFSLYQKALPARRLATKTYYGHAGAFFPETMTIWGTYNDKNYGPNRTGKPDGVTDNAFIRYYWQNGLESITLMLEYYDFTQDAIFRDNMLIPFATDILAFFDQHWKRDSNGKILFTPSQSLETWHNATNPLPEIAGLRHVLPRLLEITGSSTLKAAWQKTLADLPPVPLSPKPNQRILPAEKYDKKSNAENPELYALFPYRLYTLAAGEEALAIGKNSYAARRHKENDCWRQDPIQAALLGLNAEARNGVAGRVSRVAPGFRFPVMWAASCDWMPDQDHGGVLQVALQYMLLQYEGNRMLLLPAWPKEWNASFKLHAPKNTTVECDVSDGKITKLIVSPESRRKDVELSAPFAHSAN